MPQSTLRRKETKMPAKKDGLDPKEKLGKLLEDRSFEQLLKDHELFDVKTAAEKVGYNPKHIHRLCRTGRLGCLTRGLDPDSKEVHYFFLPEQLLALFAYRAAQV